MQHVLDELRACARDHFGGAEALRSFGKSLERVRAEGNDTFDVDAVEVVPDGSFTSFLCRYGGTSGLCRVALGMEVEPSGRVESNCVHVYLAMSHGEQDAVELFASAVDGAKRQDERRPEVGNFFLSPLLHQELLRYAWSSGIDELVAKPANRLLRRLWIERGFEPTEDPNLVRLIIHGRSELEAQESDVSLRRALHAIHFGYEDLRPYGVERVLSFGEPAESS